MKTALILFAHGSRDPEWVRPFETLRQAIVSSVEARASERSNAQHAPASGNRASDVAAGDSGLRCSADGATAVELAYLESSQPSLIDCIRSLGERGYVTIRVLPLFLAMGRHLRNDVPALARAAAAEFPALTIEFLPALGEAPEFVDALSRIAVRATR